MSRIDSRHWQISTFCSIVAAIFKMTTGINFSMSGINSGHHYLPTYNILMISDNVEFLLPIFYAVFWQPFLKWQTSRKFWKRRIAPLMVIYHYVKCYVSIIIYLEVININVRNFNFLLSVDHELVHGRSQELLDRISWNLVEL
jgi:hypothetical protein